MILNTALAEVGPPDIETASESYATRFSGKVGSFFLQTQQEKLFALLGSKQGQKILEVGGGHAQLTGALLEAGHEVWVQGSSAEALARLQAVSKLYPRRLHLLTSPLDDLPFPAGTFDAVIAIRLFAHLDNWKEVLAEMVRVTRGKVIFDFAPSGSWNALYPVLFSLKKAVEKNTRTFLRFSFAEVREALEACGSTYISEERQFLLPMVLHRLLGRPALSRKLESFCARLGCTSRFGSPALLLAEKRSR